MLGDISHHKATLQSEGKHSIHFTSLSKYKSTWSLKTGSLSNGLFTVVFADVVLLGSWLVICVEVDEDRITIFPSLPACHHIFFVPTLNLAYYSFDGV